MAGERGIRSDEVLVSLRTWEALRDAVYLLEAASEDVAMDLGSAQPTKADYVQALAHLDAAVGELLSIAIEPLALGES